MKDVTFQSVMNPDIGFTFRFNDADVAEGARIASIGWNAWLLGSDFQENIQVGSIYVDAAWAEEVHSYMGYAEPSSMLLDAAGIWHEDVSCQDADMFERRLIKNEN